MKQFRSRFVLYAFLFVLSAFVLCGAAEAGDPVTLKFLHKWPKVEYNDFFLQVQDFPGRQSKMRNIMKFIAVDRTSVV